MIRSYYAAPIDSFLQDSAERILGFIHYNDVSAETTLQQRQSWNEEVHILKDALRGFSSGRILFEYIIPRMGKRVDVVLLYQGIIFLLEFKSGAQKYLQNDYDQVYDYALDLKHFHQASHDRLLVPILVATEAPPKANSLSEQNRILQPLSCNKNTIASTIHKVVDACQETHLDEYNWENSAYFPTPTIVQAAQALYRGHHVEDITRSDAGAENLSITSAAISEIIETSKRRHRKSICFVTGVPGAGKTLIGLNTAIHRSDAGPGEHAVFLSGNYPLVQVLQEALARDRVSQEKEAGRRISKDDARRCTRSFIQIIHKYRDAFVGNDIQPPERIAIFDEAQRAWTQPQIEKFMRQKKNISAFPYSEPEFLISTMDRHSDWAVIVCLVGGGQEINTGEAGLPEWFDALRRSFSHWDIYVTPVLRDSEYTRGHSWDSMIAGLNIFERKTLHLASSVRSFRTPELAAFVKALLDVDRPNAQRLYQSIADKYPLVITRDLAKAKAWVRNQCQGTTRYGLLASSNAKRLKAEGIFVQNKIDVEHWFLNGKEDVRSSYAMEDVVTEFEIQGLELDYTLVAWDADFRFHDEGWSYHTFSGARWNNIKAADKRDYLKNTYRVLLTRARQGMVIFVPKGSASDPTRNPKVYDATYDYFRSLGIEEL